MIRIGLRDARSHFGRFIMSIVAIALGVSFVVGSFCFREMLNNQVSQMMSTNADHDVYVRGSQEKKKDLSAMSMESTKSYNDVDVDLAGTIAKVDGVSSARVVHMLSGVVLLDKHGDAVTTMGSPTLAIGMGKSSPWRSAKFTTGTWPKNGDEIALHSFAAEQSGLKVGDKTKIVYPDGAHKVTVSGIFTTDASQAGAIIIAIDPVTAKEQANKQSDDPDKTALISVYGNKTMPLDDNAQQQLADRINKALPRSAKAHAITGDEYRDESTKSTQDALGFIQPLILIFAVIALFVGSFIIANTFSMIVRESMRGYALLRSIGASPLQVFSTVIVQALLLGLVGSLAGIGLGWGMVKLIASGLANMGMPLTGATNPTVSDMLVGLVVGIVVTLIGAALPARNAALAPPIQAMNETVNPEKIRLKIQDTGSGMTPEEQKIIFQEFTRLTSHATIEGTGLGLTITLKLIHLLGGEIQLNSTPGKGSCFTILLPLGQCTTSSSTASPEPPLLPRPGIPVSGSSKILFIDDDPLQLEMAVGLLANYGIQAEATTSPQHLLNKLASTKYDLLFSDIQMPETNGFDLVKQIRNSSLPNAADLCIVALSADSGRTEKEYLDAGFSAFLSKPFTSGQLTALITQLTGISLSEPATTSYSNPAQDIERRGYSLKHILQFVDNDREALQKILDSFVMTTREHIELLKKYQEEKQWTAIVQLAHKMLPMFRQLEIDEEIPLLEKLEQATKNDLPENQISSLTQEVIDKTILLLKEDFKIS